MDENSNTTTTVELAEAVRFQRDLYLYWREAQAANGLPLTARGYLTRPALRRVLARLSGADGTHQSSDEGLQERAETDQARLFFLRRLLQRMSLLRASPEAAKLVAADTASMARYLAHPLAERLRICARLWVAGGWWPDAPDSRAPLPRLMTPAPPRVALARRRLLEQLARAADAPSASALIIPARPQVKAEQIARPRGAARRRGVAAPEREDDIQLAALSGPLLWMGLVSQQPGDASPAPTHYNVTAAALALRAVVEGSMEELAERLNERHGRVIVQSNFEVIALPPLTAPMLQLLDACTEDATLDQTARYRLTRRAFAAARQQGWSAATLIARLEAATAAPLPANVRITLGDWERHVERLRLIRDAQLLEVREATLLDALLADRGMAQFVERRLTATAALLAAEAVPRVHSWLLRRGELPATIQAGTASAKLDANDEANE